MPFIRQQKHMYQTSKNVMIKLLNQYAPRLLRAIVRHKQFVKYAISGGMSAVVQLSMLYVFTDLLHIWYVASSAISFIVAITVSFVLQKFWTFRETNMKHIRKQISIYIVVGTINFFLNPVLLYFFVETFALWYVYAQILVMGLLAIESYTINKTITFRKVVDELVVKE